MTTGCVTPAASPQPSPGGGLSLAAPASNVASCLAESAAQAGLPQAHMLVCMIDGRNDNEYAVPPWNPWLVQGPSWEALLPTTLLHGTRDIQGLEGEMPWGADTVVMASVSPLLSGLAGIMLPDLYIAPRRVSLTVKTAAQASADVVLLPAHRVVLAAASEYFAVLFSSRWSTAGVHRVCDCSDMPAHVVWVALCMAYTRRMPFEEPVRVCGMPWRRREVAHQPGWCTQCAIMLLMVEVCCVCVTVVTAIIIHVAGPAARRAAFDVQPGRSCSRAGVCPGGHAPFCLPASPCAGSAASGEASRYDHRRARCQLWCGVYQVSVCVVLYSRTSVFQITSKRCKNTRMHLKQLAARVRSRLWACSGI